MTTLPQTSTAPTATVGAADAALADASVLLSADALEVGYGGTPLLPPIDLTVRADAMWAIVGRNGSGKTTLLRTLLGLLPKVRGQLTLAPGVQMGYVPQRQSLDATVPMRVVDLVRGGLSTGWSFLKPWAHWSQDARVRSALEDVGAQHLIRADFWELSEGQKQRVLIARALVGDPRVLILDEPTSAMDQVAERDVLDLLDRMRHQRRMAVMVVSHHLAAVTARATDVLFVDRAQQIVASGALTTILADPAFIARYGDLRRDLLHEGCAPVQDDQAATGARDDGS